MLRTVKFCPNCTTTAKCPFVLRNQQVMQLPRDLFKDVCTTDEIETRHEGLEQKAKQPTGTEPTTLSVNRCNSTTTPRTVTYNARINNYTKAMPAFNVLDAYHWKYRTTNFISMYLFATVYCPQIHQSQIRGLIIACKWVFNVKFWCIVD